jgi:hypothetical protein
MPAVTPSLPPEPFQPVVHICWKVYIDIIL